VYWAEQKAEQNFVVPDDVVDVAFGIACRALPVDHLHALSEALCVALPWFTGEPRAGMHPIHGADSGNGWMRPEDPDALLYLSARTRLVLRMPRERVEAAGALAGKTLEVSGQSLRVERAAMRPLPATPTLFARYVVAGDGEDENAFLARAAAALAELGIRPRKMLCGRETAVRTGEGVIRTRSLMLAELGLAESVRLQQIGLGPRRQMGCGLFIPHKDIAPVKAAE
jgi:CRISPR-associated protein Cas6